MREDEFSPGSRWRNFYQFVYMRVNETDFFFGRGQPAYRIGVIAQWSAHGRPVT